jgi:hypothetical protein
MRSYRSALALIVSDSGGVEQTAYGGFLILGYQKSFSRHKLSAQLRNWETLLEEIYCCSDGTCLQTFIFNVNIRPFRFLATSLEIFMKQTNRRVFMMQVALGGTALAAQQAMAQALVNEKDPQATALGYAADSTKVDPKKFPKHAATQKCSNCALFQGKATDAAGACPLFAGKQVSGNGWCSAYAKKG